MAPLSLESFFQDSTLTFVDCDSRFEGCFGKNFCSCFDLIECRKYFFVFDNYCSRIAFHFGFDLGLSNFCHSLDFGIRDFGTFSPGFHISDVNSDGDSVDTLLDSADTLLDSASVSASIAHHYDSQNSSSYQKT